MTELRATLERLAARFPERGGLAGVERHRDRTRRRQRVLASVTALLIAAVGTTGAVLAFGNTRPGRVTEPAPMPPDVLRVECSADGPVVLTPEVRPQRDGLHIEAINTSDEVVIYGVRVSVGGTGRDIPPGGTHTTIVPYPPGPGDFSCERRGGYVPTGPEVAFEIVDPEGLWVSDALECPNGRAVSGSGLSSGVGDDASPEDQVRERFGDKIRDGDVLDRAQYPEPSPAGGVTVRVVRDGLTLATVHFFAAENGGWSQDSYSACQEF